MFHSKILSLYWVAGTQDCRHLAGVSPEQKLLNTLKIALENGITCFQLREKGTFSLQDATRIERLARDCRDLCHQYNVPLVINNDVLLAVKIKADGIHIGQSDMPVKQAAEYCANKLFLGVSHHSIAELKQSMAINLTDYLAIGPIFATSSKADADTPVGIEFVQAARQTCGDKPLVAIGGIGMDTIADIFAAGADGVAVISAITHASDIAQAVQKLRISSNLKA